MGAVTSEGTAVRCVDAFYGQRALQVLEVTIDVFRNVDGQPVAALVIGLDELAKIVDEWRDAKR